MQTGAANDSSNERLLLVFDHFMCVLQFPWQECVLVIECGPSRPLECECGWCRDFRAQSWVASGHTPFTFSVNQNTTA